MNFIETYESGKKGLLVGRSTGMEKLDRAMAGIRGKMHYIVAAGPKVGKTTFTDFAFIIGPYLEALKKGTLSKISWIYYSYEIDRVTKEFKFAAAFFYIFYKIKDFKYKGKTYDVDSNYLLGMKLHKLPSGESERIPVSKEHENILKEIYKNHIVKIFGKYDSEGKQLEEGLIKFYEKAENPTGFYKNTKTHMRSRGTITKTKYTTFDEDNPTKKVVKEKETGYIPNDQEHITLVVMDHVRKLKEERDMTSMKARIDKYAEYVTELRNMAGYSYSFISIVHLNRSIGNIDRIKYNPEELYPIGDDIKDSGLEISKSLLIFTIKTIWLWRLKYTVCMNLILLKYAILEGLKALLKKG